MRARIVTPEQLPNLTRYGKIAPTPRDIARHKRRQRRIKRLKRLLELDGQYTLTRTGASEKISVSAHTNIAPAPEADINPEPPEPSKPSEQEPAFGSIEYYRQKGLIW